MSFVNEKTKEINCKIIYYGPPQSGKTTSLKAIVKRIKHSQKGDLISLNSGDDRTLYFDFVPLTLGKVKGYTLRLHLYTVPGEIGYKAARALTAKGLDGVVFVADSALTKVEANLQSLKGLQEIVHEQGVDLQDLPLVFQYNKRDVPGAAALPELSRTLNAFGSEEFESVATKSEGVFEALEAVAVKVLKGLKRR